MCGHSHIDNSTVAEQTVPLSPEDPLDLAHLIYLPVELCGFLQKHGLSFASETRWSASFLLQIFREIGAMLLKEGVWPPKLCTGIFGRE